MKKFLAIFLALALVLSLAACGGAPATDATEPANSGNEGGNQASSDAIRLVNGKIEIDAQLKKLAEMYVQADPAELRISQGTNRYWNGHQPTRAMIILAALTGNIGKYAAGANWAGGTLMRFLFLR